MITKEKQVRNQNEDTTRIDKKRRDVNKRKIRRMLDKANQILQTRVW